MILNKMGVKKVRYPNLVNSGFFMKGKLFIASNLESLTKKCGSKSLERATK